MPAKKAAKPRKSSKAVPEEGISAENPQKTATRSRKGTKNPGKPHGKAGPKPKKDQKAPPPGKWARTVRELAELLNEPRSTLSDWSRSEDAPKFDPERGYDVDAWHKYRLQREGNEDEKKALKLRLDKAKLRVQDGKADAQELRNLRTREESVELEDAVAVLADAYVQLTKDFLAMENTLIPNLTGTVSENKKRFREEAIHLLRAFSVGETEAASEGGRKKQFWVRVSEELAHLQVDCLTGNGPKSMLG